jgi:hypothetical protein
VVCQVVFQPVVRLIQVTVSVIEWLLVGICSATKQLVNVVTQVLEWVCKTITETVCGAVCGVVCGACELFCGIFGCDCGCERICKTVCDVVKNVVCGWTWVARTALEWVTTLICHFVLQAVLTLLHLIEAIVTMVLTWLCSLIEILIRWFLCWTYVADIFSNSDQRWFKVAPKVIRNDQGHSDWFVYVNNPGSRGDVDQTQTYVLSDRGRPLLPVVEQGEVSYYELETRGSRIEPHLRYEQGHRVRGEPFLYYPNKVIEIASHLFGDVFARRPDDDGRGTGYERNLLTYSPHAQDRLASDGKLMGNLYNAWSGKYTGKGGSDYFGDGSVADAGTRVDTDATCNHPTNTFLHLVNGQVGFTPCDTGIAEEMSCGAGQALSFDQTNFLMLNKDDDGSAVTTYFVSKYESEETQVGCNDVLGYTIVTFEESGGPMFTKAKVLPYEEDPGRMMARIVENIAPENNAEIVRVAETYLHECGHQCGLLHDSDAPDCENDATLHIAKVMAPGEDVRRAFTRAQWCMVRTSPYMSGRPLEPFTKAPELPPGGEPPANEPPVGAASEAS